MLSQYFNVTRRMTIKKNRKEKKSQLNIKSASQTCRKPLKGAKPVPGPIIIMGTLVSAGSLKFDCRT